MRKERAEATLRARAAAWEAEKAEAQANRVCFAHTCRNLHIHWEVCDVLVTVKQFIAASCRELLHCGQLSHRQQRDTDWMSLQCRKGLSAKGGGPRMPGRPATPGSCRNSGTQTQALYGKTAL